MNLFKFNKLKLYIYLILIYLMSPKLILANPVVIGSFTGAIELTSLYLEVLLLAGIMTAYKFNVLRTIAIWSITTYFTYILFFFMAGTTLQTLEKLNLWSESKITVLSIVFILEVFIILLEAKILSYFDKIKFLSTKDKNIKFIELIIISTTINLYSIFVGFFLSINRGKNIIDAVIFMIIQTLIICTIFCCFKKGIRKTIRQITKRKLQKKEINE